MLFLPVGGMALFGAVTVWSLAPLFLLFLGGAAMVGLRPVWSPALRYAQIPPGGLCSLLLLAYGLCTIPWASVRYAAGFEFLKVAGFILAYWAWSQIASPHQRWRILLGMLLVAVTLLAWYAIIQHARGSTLVWYVPRPLQYGMRASGTYICPNHFANLLELLLPFSLAMVLTPSAGTVLRLISGYSMALFVPVLFLTQSRSGWLAATAGLGLTSLLLARRRSRRALWITLLLGALGGIVAATALWHGSPMFRERMRGAFVGSLDGAAVSRLALWKDTLRMASDAPILGHGGGAWEWLYDRYQTQTVQAYYDLAHNEYLQLLAEYGAVGLFLVAALFVTAAVRLLGCYLRTGRQRDAHLIAALLGATLATLVHACFDFNFHIPANVHMLAMLSGIVVACLFASGTLSPLRLQPPRHYLWAALALAAVVTAGFFTQRVYRSHRWYHLGESRAAELDLENAIACYQNAARIDPGYWRVPMALGDVLQMRSFWALDAAIRAQEAHKARAEYHTAIEQNPRATEAYLGLARLHEVAGESVEAERLLDLVLAAAPFNTFFHEQAGLMYKRMGNTTRARQLFERARDLGGSGTLLRNLRELSAPPVTATE